MRGNVRKGGFPSLGLGAARVCGRLLFVGRIHIPLPGFFRGRLPRILSGGGGKLLRVGRLSMWLGISKIQFFRNAGFFLKRLTFFSQAIHIFFSSDWKSCSLARFARRLFPRVSKGCLERRGWEEVCSFLCLSLVALSVGDRPPTLIWFLFGSKCM